ncbi:MAG: hypothetical protein RBR86_06725 [Pseudobdellovibrionaceae bacterium]|jgi:hypothetical protein|nr:hypothetical protein [Pseudobdellovibrionaceae bacterium]
MFRVKIFMPMPEIPDFTNPENNEILRYACSAEDLHRFDLELDQSKPDLFMKAMECLMQLLHKPEEFPDPHHIVKGIFSKSVHPNIFFARQNLISANNILALCTNDARPETARAGALLLAEFIRCRHLGRATEDYSVNADKLVRDAKDYLKGAFDQTKLFGSVKMIQNTLVEMVRDVDLSGHELGAVQILNMLSDDASEIGGARYWTKKITAVRDAQAANIDLVGTSNRRFSFRFEP